MKYNKKVFIYFCWIGLIFTIVTLVFIFWYVIGDIFGNADYIIKPAFTTGIIAILCFPYTFYYKKRFVLDNNEVQDGDN